MCAFSLALAIDTTWRFPWSRTWRQLVNCQDRLWRRQCVPFQHISEGLQDSVVGPIPLFLAVKGNLRA